MPSILDFLLRQPGPIGTPPFVPDDRDEIPRALSGFATGPISAGPTTVGGNPAAGPPVPPPETLLGKVGGFASGISNKLGESLDSPLGRFSAQLLARSGPSLTPQSTLANIGGAAIDTQELGRQDRMDALQKQLIEGQLDIQRARAEAARTPKQPTAATDIGKILQDERNGIITPEQRQTALASIEAASSKEKQEATKSLRGEFRTDTDGVRQSLSDLAKSKALVTAGNPIAATAAFTSFIRSIDNSVVRPAEQAAYSAAGGLSRQVQDALSKLQGQGPLSVDSQNDLLQAIDTIEQQLRGINDRTIEFYNQEADQFGLRPESVTGIPTAESPDVPQQTGGSGSDEQLRKLNEQIAEAEKVLEELERGNQ